MAKRTPPIAIYPGTPLGQPDYRTHFWYHGQSDDFYRMCDEAEWPDGVPPDTNQTIDIPCTGCRDLYRYIIARDGGVEPHAPVDYPTLSMAPSPTTGGYPQITEMAAMQIDTQPLTAFARFFEASPSQKVTMVRDARLYQSDPSGYAQRAYYGVFRNVLKRTHWKGSDLGTFEATLEDVIAEQKVSSRQEHYRDLGKAYVAFWSLHDDVAVFPVPPAEMEIAGLKLRVTSELGVGFGGNDYALEVYFRAPKPTRLYRQAVQYLTQQARSSKWSPEWVVATYDVRRKLILPDLQIRPQDLRLALEGAAANFQQIWESLDRQDLDFA